MRSAQATHDHATESFPVNDRWCPEPPDSGDRTLGGRPSPNDPAGGATDLSTPTKYTPTEGGRLKRRVARLRKGGMLDVARLNTTVERAVTASSLMEAYALVHDTYVEKGYMLPALSGVRVRTFEALPEMATFVARVSGKVVAVTSVILDTPELGLPSDHAFGREIDSLRRQRGRVCEITNLAVVREYRNTPVFLQLTQACFAHAMANGCGNMFVAISPGHARFFRDVLQFDTLGPRRNYSDEVEDVVEGMHLKLTGCEGLARDIDAMMGPEDAFLHDLFFARNAMHQFVAIWDVMAARLFADPIVLRELFVFRTHLLAHCTKGELAAIAAHWGDETYARAYGHGPAKTAPTSNQTAEDIVAA